MYNASLLLIIALPAAVLLHHVDALHKRLHLLWKNRKDLSCFAAVSSCQYLHDVILLYLCHIFILAYMRSQGCKEKRTQVKTLKSMILCFLCLCVPCVFSTLNYLRRKRNNLHEILV